MRISRSTTDACLKRIAAERPQALLGVATSEPGMTPSVVKRQLPAEMTPAAVSDCVPEALAHSPAEMRDPR